MTDLSHIAKIFLNLTKMKILLMRSINKIEILKKGENINSFISIEVTDQQLMCC